MLTSYTAGSIYAAEAPALNAGVPLMARAALGLADVVERFSPAGAGVAVFAGKGNNGADGLYAAAHLARRGFAVTAVTALEAPEQSPAGAACEAAAEAGVRVVGWSGESVRRAASAEVWIDGLTGIGMRPPARGHLGELLELLASEHSGRPDPPLVFSVDLPSGLSADSGAVRGPVVPADHTVTFGGYKAVHFLPPAAPRCGRVHLIDIGIEESFTAQPVAVHRVQARDLTAWWPVPGVHDHKYTRGVVGMVTGSKDYPGAAVLSVHGALAAGPGMVRYLGEVPEYVIQAHPEVITRPGRVQAWVVGSGVAGRASSAVTAVQEALEAGLREDVPLVVDAGALEWVEGGTLAGRAITPRVVLTPHAGELAQLLTRCGIDATREDVESDPSYWARAAVENTGATVVLKGGITLICSPDATFSQADGTPWMASAGSGDVLAGVLGTVLAGWAVHADSGEAPTWPSFAHAVAGGVALHGLAGTRAARGGPTTASEVAAALTPTLRTLLAD